MKDQAKFYRRLNSVFEQLATEHKYLSSVAATNRTIVENTSASLESELDKINQMFNAARKGLGLVNKLPYGDSKLKHTRRVMGNLNRIRGSLRRLESQMSEIIDSGSGR